MPPVAELSARIRRRLRAKLTQLQHRSGLPTLSPGSARISTRFRHPLDSTSRETLIARYREQFPDAVQAELREAQQLLEHRFNLLGHAVEHGPQIRWSLDPVSGGEWSRGFSPQIPYRGPQRLGDIKLPWELNKHQYFFTLGKAAWLTGDEVFAREIVRQIDHWITDNPCHRGIHWVSALESGTRVLSWILAYPFFRDVCDAAFRERMLRSIAQHLLFVERNLSIDRFANTHLAGEAAILVIGALFVDCRHSRRWLRKGLHHLNEQIVRQVRVDGAHAEQSVAYHRFFLDQYYLVDAMLAANGASLPAPTLATLERMTGFLMDMLFADGTAPAFGDGDDARGIWCRADCLWEYRSLLALGAVRFGRGDFRHVAREPAEELLWLHGEAGLARFDSLPAEAPAHDSAAYPDAGYYALRSGWNSDDSVLVFDCGPLGHGPAGHGHADALSFQLHAGGYPFLIDPGTYSYNLDYAWRDNFRGTRAHNTVAVDGLDQSVMQDRMSWKVQARTHCNRWLTTAQRDLVDAAHDGYARLGDPVAHRREVVFIKPDLWVVRDELTGHGQNHDLEWLFHLRPDCRFERGGECCDFVLVSPQGVRLSGWVFDETNGESAPELINGSESERAVWFSPSYGVRIAGQAVRIRRGLAAGRRTLRVCFSTSEAMSREDALRLSLTQ